jgi:phosphonate transport system substrate-binding protein
LVLGAALLASASGCEIGKKKELGSEANPIKLFFTPSVDAKVIDASGKEIQAFLESETRYKFEVKIPQSYIAVVEAFGSKRADVAALNTFGYLLAHEKFGAEARLLVIRFGSATYQSQIIVRAKSSFKDVKDLNGKKFAFVDPASLSGYLLPLKDLADAGVKLGDTVFAMKHDNVVSMVYQGQVDAGATFYTPPGDGKIQDARRLVKTQYPDVEEKVRILKLTHEIPNDPIAFRKDLPLEMKQKIASAFIKFVATPAGRDAFSKLYGVTGIQSATDADYDGVREMLKALGKSPSELAH